MYLSVPNYTTKYSTTPIKDACAFLQCTNFDWFNLFGDIRVAIYSDVASAYSPTCLPIDSWTYTIPPTSINGQESLPELVAQNQAMIDQLMQIIFGLLMGDKRFEGATVVTTPPSGGSS